VKKGKPQKREEVYSIDVAQCFSLAAGILLKSEEIATKKKKTGSLVVIADKWMELGAMIHNINEGKDEEKEGESELSFGFADAGEIAEDECELEEGFDEDE